MTAPPIVLVGGGGHGRVLIDLLQLISRPILGICDPALIPGTSGPMGVTVLGGDDVLMEHSPDEIELANGIGSVTTLTARDTLYRRCRDAGFRFATLRHPSAVIARDALLDEGAQIMAGVVIQCGVEIGANSILNTRASVDHDCKLGESVHLAPGALLCGAVVIGDRTHVGTGAIIIQGVRVGADCHIGAGSLVTRDVPPGTRLRASRDGSS